MPEPGAPVTPHYARSFHQKSFANSSSPAGITQICYEQNNAFKSILRLAIVAVLTLSGVLAFIPQAHAKDAWKEDKNLSKEYAEKGKWKKACSYAVSAGAAMDEKESLTIDYMGKLGKRCTEAAN